MAAKKKPAPKRGASRQTAPAKKPIPGGVWRAAGLTVGACMVFLRKHAPGGAENQRTQPEQQRTEKADDGGKATQAPTQQ